MGVNGEDSADGGAGFETQEDEGSDQAVYLRIHDWRIIYIQLDVVRERERGVSTHVK